MAWFVVLIVFIFIVCRFFGSKNGHCDKSNQNVCDQPAGKTVTDDFVGGSVGAFFLLEETIGPGVGGQASTNKGLAQSEQGEDDFFEEEFFD